MEGSTLRQTPWHADYVWGIGYSYAVRLTSAKRPLRVCFRRGPRNQNSHHIIAQALLPNEQTQSFENQTSGGLHPKASPYQLRMGYALERSMWYHIMAKLPLCAFIGEDRENKNRITSKPCSRTSKRLSLEFVIKHLVKLCGGLQAHIRC